MPIDAFILVTTMRDEPGFLLEEGPYSSFIAYHHHIN